jgi:cytoskeletal protein RodZ
LTGKRRFPYDFVKSNDDGKLPVNMTNFGASFKKARESKGISLDQVATDTRISTRFLSAIENEEFHLLPGGIFNRGFVRAYAERVGINPDQAVADYERLSGGGRDGTDTPVLATTIPRKGNRFLYPVAAGLLALVITIFYIVNREGVQPAQKALPPPAPTNAAPEPTQPAPPAQTIPAETKPEAPIATAPEPAPLSKPQNLTVDIEAREETWIKVKADGSSVNSGEVLQPGMTRKFTAQDSIAISIGNAGGLTLKINDQTAKPLGKSGQVREVTITPNNLRDFIG